MTTRKASIYLLFLSSLFLFANSVFAIEINDCAELQLISYDAGYPVDGDYTLGNDIDCSMTDPADPDWDDAGPWANGFGFNPIGRSPVGQRFIGTFDGQSHVISGLFISTSTLDMVGLFGYTVGAEISNVGLEDVSITVTNNDDYVGGLIGLMHTGTTTNSYVTGAVSSDGAAVGGFVGVLDYGAGGLTNPGAVIYDAYADVDVECTGDCSTGGFIGWNYGWISYAYSIGSVDGGIGWATGGFAADTETKIYSLFSAGAVTAEAGTSRGGFSGTDSSFSPIRGSSDIYYDITLSGLDYCSEDGLGTTDGCTGVNDANSDPDYFFDSTNEPFTISDVLVWEEDVWFFSGDDYPVLLSFCGEGECVVAPDEEEEEPEEEPTPSSTSSRSGGASRPVELVGGLVYCPFTKSIIKAGEACGLEKVSQTSEPATSQPVVAIATDTVDVEELAPPIESVPEEETEEVLVVEPTQLPPVRAPLPERDTAEELPNDLSTTLSTILLTGIAVLSGFTVVVQTTVVPGFLSGVNPGRHLGFLGLFFGKRRRKNAWGTIYDSVTKQPLDPAVVTLYDTKGNEVSAAVTDIDGRYGFLLEPGRYKMSTAKTNYTFPSHKLLGQSTDVIYENLYFGEEFEVEIDKPLVIRDIPMDSVSQDWNELAKSERGLIRFYSKHDVMVERFISVLVTIGVVGSLVALIMNPSYYNGLVIAVYAVLVLIRSFSKPQRYGKIMTRGGDVLKFATVKIFQVSTGVTVRQTVTDNLGRYFCIVPNGEYYAQVEMRTGPDTFAPVYTSGGFKVTKGVIDNVFKV